MGMFELLALLFIVGVGYMIYRVIRHIKKRNEQADAYDSVLAGMERMNAGRNAPPETNASSPSYPSHVVMGMPIPPIIPPVVDDNVEATPFEDPSQVVVGTSMPPTIPPVIDDNVEATKRCPHCEAKLPASAKFCGTCGTRLDGSRRGLCYVFQCQWAALQHLRCQLSVLAVASYQVSVLKAR